MTDYSLTNPILQKISYPLVVDLLRMTLLVYNYGKDISLINVDDTVETFVDGLKKGGEFEHLNLNETRKKILEDIAYNVPSGKLVKFIQDEKTDIQVGVTLCEAKHRISIVFRGSESAADWYYDLLIMKHKLSDNIRVHSGFYKQLTQNNVYEKIVSEVKNTLIKYPSFDIYITGHSLGGALSTLFGYMLSNEIPNHITVVSFASPRVGNYAWKQAFNSKENLTHYRIANNRDIVTAFPFYRYYHVGHNIRLLSENYKLVPQDTPSKCCEETIFTCWKISEHDCELYYNRLTKTEW
jgi:hypothetical protein